MENEKERWEIEFDQKFGIFGSFWDKWANGNFPEQGGISDDLKAWIKDNFIPKNL